MNWKYLLFSRIFFYFIPVSSPGVNPFHCREKKYPWNNCFIHSKHTKHKPTNRMGDFFPSILISCTCNVVCADQIDGEARIFFHNLSFPTATKNIRAYLLKRVKCSRHRRGNYCTRNSFSKRKKIKRNFILHSILFMNLLRKLKSY